MKKIITFTISILIILISCDKEDVDQRPNNFSASDGFYVGCIHIEYEKKDNVTVTMERREKGTNDWITISGGIGSNSFDDNEGYFEEGMPPGKVFEYRLRNDMGNNQEYSEIEEGFAFQYVSISNIEVSSSVDYQGNIRNSLRWNAGNHNSFLNESEILFNVCRSTDSLGTFQIVGTVGEDRSYTDVISATDNSENFFYRIDIFYRYKIINFRGATIWCETKPYAGTISEPVSQNNGNPTISYASTDLGLVASSTTGGITQLLEKNVNGTLYLGLINDAVSTGYGTPELYSLNGTSWQKEWTSNPIDQYDKISYAIASTGHYLAGTSGSLSVYEWNGVSWSNNLAPDNLGQADEPNDVAIEVDNDKLYMAIEQYPNYDLQVLMYNESTWDTIGGDVNGIIASNTFDIKLEKINDVLYLYYRVDNTLHVKHLNGNSWETDLTWTKDNIYNIKIAKSSSALYFISDTRNSIYLGGVYKVTSTSTAEEIISNSTAEWFQFPLSIAIDSEENLIVASMKYNESTNSFYPFLNLYNGMEWKTISGAFSDGIDPVSISAIGTDIIYNYGDAFNVNTIGDPQILKSKKFTK